MCYGRSHQQTLLTRPAATIQCDPMRWISLDLLLPWNLQWIPSSGSPLSSWAENLDWGEPSAAWSTQSQVCLISKIDPQKILVTITACFYLGPPRSAQMRPFSRMKATKTNVEFEEVRSTNCASCCTNLFHNFAAVIYGQTKNNTLYSRKTNLHTRYFSQLRRG